MNNKKYKELVNPTFYTGQQTLFMLANAGNKAAARYINTMGIENGLQTFMDNNDIELSQEDRAGLMKGASLGVEARYAAVSRLLKESGYKSVFDIGCGYTPRALTCMMTGIDYVGMDLPVVIDKMSEVAKRLNLNTSHPAYIKGDATNVSSVMKASDYLNGPLFITSEGLLQYLVESELEQFIEALKGVLAKHGGTWYSSDMDVSYEKLAAVFMEDPQALTKYNEVIAAMKDNSEIYFEGAKFATDEEKQKFFENRGLKVEKVPFYTDSTKLNLLKENPEKAEAAQKLLSSFNVWKLTLAEDATFANTVFQYNETRKVENLTINYGVLSDMLLVQLIGRVDTLSAPELLQIFEEENEESPSEKVIIDATDLDYISSAGLRVLMIMVKKLGKESVIIRNVNDTVKEIFEATGFDSILTIED